MNIPDPQFVGFFPHRTEKKPEWLENHGVTEVCSVSDCISPSPENWIEKWKHNELGFFDSEVLALSIVNDAGPYDLYAYKMFPLQFSEGEVTPYVIPVNPTADLASFEFLGHDPVSRSAGFFPECSPLSCNNAAEDFEVNEHCLIQDREPAYQATIAISKGNYEPGPYYLFEVYRKRG
jgi:hypothetical protein